MGMPEDLELELAEGTKLGANGVYPANSKNAKDADGEFDDAVSKTAQEVITIVRFGGAVE